MCFPDGWVDKSMKYHQVDDSVRYQYYEMDMKNCKRKEGEPDLMDEKFKEIINRLGIKMYVEDKQGNKL